jgi:hypothetical protein
MCLDLNKSLTFILVFFLKYSCILLQWKLLNVITDNVNDNVVTFQLHYYIEEVSSKQICYYLLVLLNVDNLGETIFYQNKQMKISKLR